MKISEIVIESDASDVVDLSKQNVAKGYDTVSKILSPSKWFSKGKDVKLDPEPRDDEPRNTAQRQPTYNDKTAVLSAASGKEILPQDQAKLKALAMKVSTGKLKPNNIDHMQLYWALKTAYLGKPLNDEQKQLLNTFSKQI